MLIRILVAVADRAEGERLCAALASVRDVHTTAIQAPERFWAELRQSDVDLVVTDEPFVGIDIRGFVESLRGLPDRPEVMIVGMNDDEAGRTRLLAAGCLAVIPAGLEDAVLAETLPGLIARVRQQADIRVRADRPEERHRLSDFISRSPAMIELMDLAGRVVHAESSLLITGETGVGKERLARAIHAEGPRAAGPFLAVNCAALAESLLESELFGHEKGAFTGATRARKGYFELAHGGTLFLDEIGEMPAQLQVKLLRAVDERCIFRVGGEEALAVDVRLMAATNRDLESDMSAGRFRPDLFYRLAVVTIALPPLRERRQDIPQLVEDYLVHFELQTRRHVNSVSDEAMEVLVRYDWPGNVRELINAVERAVLLGRGPTLSVSDLPARLTAAVLGASSRAESQDSTIPGFEDLQSAPFLDARRRLLDAFDRRYLDALLRKTDGRVGMAAQRAGTSERTLRQHLKRLGLRKENYRRPAGRRGASHPRPTEGPVKT